MRQIKILGTGKYLPKLTMGAEELGKKLGVSADWIIKKSGVLTRYYAGPNESTVTMAAQAAQQAADAAGIRLDQIDAIVNASGTPYMPIPCMAAVLHHTLGLQHTTIPAFDINSTCLSFITALDLVASMIAQGRFKRVLIVSSEHASAALNWNDHDSATLFGDGAAAVIVGPSTPEESSAILSAGMETFSEGWEYCKIIGGGSHVHPREHQGDNDPRFLFSMDGPRLFKLVSRRAVPFINRILQEAQFSLPDVDIVVPHQASQMAMRILQSKLDVRDEQWVSIIENHGNVIAASIPMGLHEAIIQGRLKRGQTALLCGTSAGVSLGGLLLRY